MFETIGQITVAAAVIGGGWYAYTKGWLDTPIAWVVSQWVAWRAKP